MVRDWKAIAQATGLEVPQEDWNRIAGPLDALEEAFRPLAKELPFDLEPSTGICDEEDAV